MPYLYVINVFLVVIAAYSAIHALIYKKDSRAAFGWVAVCILLPFVGPILYFLFGINRVKTRAQKLTNIRLDIDRDEEIENLDDELNRLIPNSLDNIKNVSRKISTLPLVGGNQIKSLGSGEQAYSEMLSAINAANDYVYLCVYIFKRDVIGQKFIDALVSANDRGVGVYVLVDGVGELYSRKKARKALIKKHVQVRRFLPPSLIPFSMSINLRNHRKLLIIDNKVSFIGGMNIADEYFQPDNNEAQPLKDIHFKINGDLSLQLKNIFESDWRFAGGDFNRNSDIDYQETDKGMICRAIIDGPGENLDHLSIILLCAINSASSKIILMTPYFLPSRELIGALQTAALRGVEVSIILPEKNNLNFVQWASRHMLWELLENGAHIYYQPPPFSHAKLFVIDDQYSLIGSANIDPRSLRLNYEVGVEVYDAEFATKLSKYAQSILEDCRKVTLEEVDSRPLFIKIRDGIAWLFSPYL